MSSGLLYLSASDVEAAMPPVAERIALAERTMIALVADAELPPKIGLHPRPPGSFAHAMPASLRPSDRDDAGADLLGIKWVAGFPANRATGLPAISAVVVLSDPSTGRPVAILDGGPITAQRTAAVSGVALAHFGPGASDDGSAGDGPSVALIGAGVQGASHLAVIGHVLPGAHVLISDRHPERAAALADLARTTPGIAEADTVPEAQAATRDADVVITGVSFTDPARRQVMTTDWLRPDALVVPVDYATMCAAEVARDAALFLVDDRGQFLANRDAGQFHGYPDPAATFGEAILAGTPRPPAGRVVTTHLGVGLADVIFADAIVTRARAAGLGTMLPD
jgi:ornithine cyclodeaminase/alanine dehydrogenase-like protein (mu-crystallin family)